MSLPQNICKIVVTGTSGCGKTTLGKHLSEHLGAKLVDLDEFYWLPGWKKRDDEEFFSQIKRELTANKWVVCGNYSRGRDEIWPQADMIIWLDLSLRVCLWRALKRSFDRLLRKQVCCNGNYETFVRLIGKESILLWIWNTHSKRKKAYSAYFANPTANRHLIRLTNRHEVSEFIKKWTQLELHESVDFQKTGNAN